MGIAGFFVFLFLVDSPEIVNCQEPPTLSSTSRRYTDPRRLENQTDSDGTEPDSADIVIGEQVSLFEDLNYLTHAIMYT